MQDRKLRDKISGSENAGSAFFDPAFCRLMHYTPCPEKSATLFLAITLPNANRFSKFFSRQI